jgi:hypothetical protein
VFENWIDSHALEMGVCCGGARLRRKASPRRHYWKGRHDAPNEHPAPDACLHTSPRLPPGSLHQPVLQRFRHVISAYALHLAKVGDGSSDFQHAVVAACAQSESLYRSLQQVATRDVGTARMAPSASAQFSIRSCTGRRPSPLLPYACGANALTDDGGVLARRRFCDGRNGHGRDLDDEVDSIAKRTREPSAITRNLCGRAAARPSVVTAEATGTRVHCGDEDEPGRKDRSTSRAGDRDAAFLERLPQDLEYPSVKLGHLIEEEHTVVCE